MEHKIIHQLSAPKGEFLEPPQSSKPIIASSYELHPGFIAMVLNKPSQGSIMKTLTITWGNLSGSVLA
jgi:hypothetical protein